MWYINQRDIHTVPNIWKTWNCVNLFITIDAIHGNTLYCLIHFRSIYSNTFSLLMQSSLNNFTIGYTYLFCFGHLISRNKPGKAKGFWVLLTKEAEVAKLIYVVIWNGTLSFIAYLKLFSPLHFTVYLF